MTYQFTEKCTNISAVEMWHCMKNGLSNDVTIKSIGQQKLPYTVNNITNDEVSLSTATRNKGEPEIIPFNDFTVVVERLKSIKHLYRQSIFSANRYS